MRCALPSLCSALLTKFASRLWRRHMRNMQGEYCAGNARQAYNCYTRQMILRLCQSASTSQQIQSILLSSSMRSAHHGGSIVHLYQSQVQIARPRLGAYVTIQCRHWCPTRFSSTRIRNLARTGDTLKMLGATGHTAALNCILMGVETVDDGSVIGGRCAEYFG